jgi:hypothetical protein
MIRQEIVMEDADIRLRIWVYRHCEQVSCAVNRRTNLEDLEMIVLGRPGNEKCLLTEPFALFPGAASLI